MGFLLPRSASINNNNICDRPIISMIDPEIENRLICPTGLYHSSNDGKNKFLMQSYECVRSSNEVKYLNDTCLDCEAMWNSMRKNSFGKTISMTEFNKRIKSNDNIVL